MSASSTWWPPFAPSFRSVSSAIVALRFGPEAVRARPGSPPRRSAPAPASPPSAPLGPAPSGCPAAASFHRPSGCTAAAPPAAGTRLLAARRRALPGSARRRTARPPRSSGHRLPPRPCSASPASTLPAGRHSSRCGRTARGSAAPVPLGRGPQPALQLSHFVARLTPAGVVGSGLAGHALALTCSADATTAGTLPSGRVVRRAPSSGTTIPSDSRCAALDFAFGLYEPPCPDDGCADGSLVFRTSPCTRAAPPTPPGPDGALPDLARRMLPSP